jgi:Protein of unknown function (DUF4242)
VTVYIVERSLSGLSDKHRSAMQYALGEASRRVTASGSRVRYLGSTFVPARSRCFYLSEATSPDVVRAVNEAALVPYNSINEANEFPASQRMPNARRPRTCQRPHRP